MWVSNEGSGTVSRIAPKRNKVVKTIRVGGGPNGIAVAFKKVWVADYGHSHLIRIDPVRNRVEKRISLPKADWITPSADALWVSSEGGKIYKIDPASMGVMATVTVGANPLATSLGGRQALGAEHRRQQRLGGRPGDGLGREHEPHRSEPARGRLGRGPRLGHV